MKGALLYILAGLMLVLIVSVAWWERLAEQPSEHIVRQGETLTSISTDLGVEPGAIADANGVEVNEIIIRPGVTILVPKVPTTGTGVWLAHGAGIIAEITGVLLSFWLGLVAGIVPRGYRQQILGISAALGVASYAANYAGTDQAISITPGFLFTSIKDGFMWAAAFPLFAAAFGMRQNDDSRTSAADRRRVAPRAEVDAPEGAGAGGIDGE